MKNGNWDRSCGNRDYDHGDTDRNRDHDHGDTDRNRDRAYGQRYALTGILTVLLLTAADQLTKHLAVDLLKGSPAISVIDGVLEFAYLENRGMAFGLLQGKIPFFIVVCVLFFAAVFYVYVRIPKNRYYLPLMTILFVILSGALGNLIDRLWRGYVVDYISLALLDFPVFNLADIYVVCGGFLLVLLVCLRYKDEQDFDFLKIKR